MKRAGSVTENATKKSKMTSPASAKQAIARIKAAVIENDTKINFSAPSDVMETLFSPKTSEEFMATYWEKTPMHLKRENAEYYGSAFTLAAFKELVKEKELLFEDDVDCFKYNSKSEKKHLNGEGRLTLEKAEELLTKDKATLLFHQPQRYANILWNLLEKMETYFGSTVGASVYVTPADSQSLAPHCDDTEAIIMQLEGSVSYSIYKPKVVLAHDFTMDLIESEIGEPMMVLDLQPGDLLYIPRGHIHQSKNASKEHSTTLELSTYSANCWGDFMNYAVVQAIENAMESSKDISYRSGLPLNYKKFLGTGKNLQKYIEVPKEEESSKEEKKEEEAKEEKTTPTEEKKESKLSSNSANPNVIAFKDLMREKLSKLVDHIDVDASADTMTADFVAARLPPFDYAPKEEYIAPTKDDKISVKFKDHVQMFYCTEDDGINQSMFEEGNTTETEDEATEDEETEDEAMEEEDTKEEAKDKEEKTKEEAKKSPAAKKEKTKSEDIGDEDTDDEDDEDADTEHDEEQMDSCIKILTSLRNKRDTHMTGDASKKPWSMKLPLHYACAMTHLLSATEPTLVCQLPGLDDEQDKLFLATNLYDGDVVQVSK